MKTDYTCIACFFAQIENTLKLVAANETQRQKLYEYLTQALLSFDFRKPPVVFGRTIYKKISRITGVKDPFKKEKLYSERFLNKNNSFFEKKITAASDSLYAALQYASLGNTIDFGRGKKIPLSSVLKKAKEIRFSINDYRVFKKLLKNAKSILFIADNVGETFFDKFLIEQIAQYNSSIKVYYGVRSAPILNDATLEDAKRCGLHKVSKVFSTGCDAPGILLKETNKRFKKIYRSADFVVSKGQGNFESLKDQRKDIFYLLKVKCPVVSKYVRKKEGSYIFMYNRGHGVRK